MRFTKMHGAGNDFVVLDLRGGQSAPSASLCRLLGDRHFGVGCDQILTIEAPRDPHSHARYGIWNSDGSTAGQCGNGARCVAAWLAREDRIEASEFMLESPAGSHRVTRVGADQWRIGMGHPRFEPTHIPMRGVAVAADAYRVELDGEQVSIGAVSMGNPHALVISDDVSAAAVHRIGPALQASTMFPDSVNVGFAQVVSREHVRLRVFERGAGETLACGSGACAAAAMLMQRGLIERRATVSLPGGDLLIEWPGGDAGLDMTGPATFVFDGILDAAILGKHTNE